MVLNDIPDAAKIIEELQFDYVTVDDGVQIIIDFSHVSSFKCYKMAFKQYLTNLATIPFQFMVNLGSSASIDNFKYSDNELLSEKYFF